MDKGLFISNVEHVESAVSVGLSVGEIHKVALASAELRLRSGLGSLLLRSRSYLLGLLSPRSSVPPLLSTCLGKHSKVLERELHGVGIGESRSAHCFLLLLLGDHGGPELAVDEVEDSQEIILALVSLGTGVDEVGLGVVLETESLALIVLD